MGRVRRTVVRWVAHYLCARSARKGLALFRDCHDYDAYVRILDAACRKWRVLPLSWGLLEDRVELVAFPDSAEAFSRALAEANRVYARRLNKATRSRGTVFEPRFRACALDYRHALAAVRMIELAPWRLQLVTKPWRWPWSSAYFRSLHAKTDPLIDDRTFCGLIRDWRKFYYREDDREAEARIRKCIGAGRPAGDARFVEWMEAQAGRKLAPGKRGRKAGKAP